MSLNNTCSYQDELDLLKRKLIDTQTTVEQKNNLIGLLKDQLKNMECSHKITLDNMKKINMKYCTIEEDYSSLKNMIFNVQSNSQSKRSQECCYSQTDFQSDFMETECLCKNTSKIDQTQNKFCESCNVYRRTINDLKKLVVEYVHVIGCLEEELKVLDKCLKKVNSVGDGQQTGQNCKTYCKANKNNKDKSKTSSSNVKMQELKNEVEKLKQEINCLLSREESFKNEANKNITRLEQDNNCLKSKLDKFQMKDKLDLKLLDDLNATIKLLTKEKCEQNLTIKQMQLEQYDHLSQISELENTVCSLNEELNKSTEQFLSTANEKISTDDCSCNTMEAELKKYSDIIVDLVIEQEKNVSIKSENECLKNKLKEMEEAKQEESKNIQCKTTNLINENNALKAENEKYNKTICTLRKDQERTSKLIEENFELKKQIDCLKDSFECHKEQYKTLENHQELYQKTKNEASYLKSEIHSLNQKIQCIQKENKSLNEMIFYLRSEVEKCNKVIIDLVVNEEKLHQLEQENEELKNKVKELKHQEIKQSTMKSISTDFNCENCFCNISSISNSFVFPNEKITQTCAANSSSSKRRKSELD